MPFLTLQGQEADALAGANAVAKVRVAIAGTDVIGTESRPGADAEEQEDDDEDDADDDDIDEEVENDREAEEAADETVEETCIDPQLPPVGGFVLVLLLLRPLLALEASKEACDPLPDEGSEVMEVEKRAEKSVLPPEALSSFVEVD